LRESGYFLVGGYCCVPFFQNFSENCFFAGGFPERMKKSAKSARYLIDELWE
jgi:hypothetical protein